MLLDSPLIKKIGAEDLTLVECVGKGAFGMHEVLLVVTLVQEQCTVPCGMEQRWLSSRSGWMSCLMNHLLAAFAVRYLF